MTDDIVARLREEGFITHMARLPRESKILHAAADEIERLRTVVQGWENSARNAERDITELRAERDEAEPLLEELWQRRTESTEMRAEIERLRLERDELMSQLSRIAMARESFEKDCA